MQKVEKLFGDIPLAELNYRRALKASSSRLDLSDLTYEARQSIYEQFANNTINMPQIVQNLGTPGMSLPTSSPYNSFGKYFIDPQLEAGQRNSSSIDVFNENIG